MGAQFCGHYHEAQRAVRGTAQSDADGHWARSVAGLARGGAIGPVRTQSPSRALPIGGDDLLAGEHARREREEQRSYSDRADRRGLIISAPRNMNLDDWRPLLFIIRGDRVPP